MKATCEKIAGLMIKNLLNLNRNPQLYNSITPQRPISDAHS